MAEYELAITSDSARFVTAASRATLAAEAFDDELRRMTRGAVGLDAALSGFVNELDHAQTATYALNQMGVQTTAQVVREIAALNTLAQTVEGDAVAVAELTRRKEALVRTLGNATGAMDTNARGTSRSAQSLYTWTGIINDAQMFSVSWSMGLRSISNQLPLLVQGINATSAAGQRLQMSMGWISLAVQAAITLFVLFGDESEGAFGKAESAADRLRSALDDIIEVQERQFKLTLTTAKAEQLLAATRSRQENLVGDESGLERFARKFDVAAKSLGQWFGRDLKPWEDALLATDKQVDAYGALASVLQADIDKAKALDDALKMLDDLGAPASPVSKRSARERDTPLEAAIKDLKEAGRAAAEVERVGAALIGAIQARASLLKQLTAAQLGAASAQAALNAEDLRAVTLAQLLARNAEDHLDVLRQRITLEEQLRQQTGRLYDLSVVSHMNVLGTYDEPTKVLRNVVDEMGNLVEVVQEAGPSLRVLEERHRFLQQQQAKSTEAIGAFVAILASGVQAGDRFASVVSERMEKSLARLQNQVASMDWSRLPGALSDAEKAAVVRSREMAKGPLSDDELRGLGWSEEDIERFSRLDAAARSLASTLNTQLVSGITNVASAFGTWAAGESGIEAVGAALLGSLGSLASELGAAMIGVGIGGQALWAGLKSLAATPAGAAALIVGGAGLVALGAYLGSKAQSIVSKHSGGAASTGSRVYGSDISYGGTSSRPLPGQSLPWGTTAPYGYGTSQSAQLEGTLRHLDATLARIDRGGLRGDLEVSGTSLRTNRLRLAQRDRMMLP